MDTHMYILLETGIMAATVEYIGINDCISLRIENSFLLVYNAHPPAKNHSQLTGHLEYLYTIHYAGDDVTSIGLLEVESRTAARLENFRYDDYTSCVCMLVTSPSYLQA